jgi:hypothetical protein
MSKSVPCLDWDWDLRPTWSYVAAITGASLAPLAATLVFKKALPDQWSVLAGGAAGAATIVAATAAMRAFLHARWSLVAGALILAAAMLGPALLFRGDPSRGHGAVDAAAVAGAGLFFLSTIPAARSNGYAISVALSMAIATALTFCLV